MGFDVFICYRRDGSGFLPQAVRNQLVERGYRVFLDVDGNSIKSGNFDKQIFQVLSECNDVIVVLPPHALDRCSDEEDWVRREVEFAFKNNKRLIPLMMREFDFPPVLPSGMDDLRNQQGVTADPEFFDAVIDRLCGYMTSRPHSFRLLPQRQKNLSAQEKKPEHTIGPIGTLFHSLNKVAVGMDLLLLLLGAAVFLWEPAKQHFSGTPLVVVAAIMIAALIGLIVSLRVLLSAGPEINEFSDIGPEYLDGSYSKLVEQLIYLDGEHLIRSAPLQEEYPEEENAYLSIRRFNGITVATSADYIRWVPAKAPRMSFFFVGHDMFSRDILKSLKYLPFEYVSAERDCLEYTYHGFQITFRFSPNRFLPIRPLRQLESLTVRRTTAS